MKSRFTKEERADIIACYWNKTPVAALCANYGISKSTLYSWLTKHSTKLVEQNPVWKPAVQKEFSDLKRRAEKMSQILSVMERAGIRSMLPLEDKLVLFDEYRDQYSSKVLCEALGISRGTYSNRIVNQRTPQVNKNHREQMKGLIQAAFEESEQRYGADKILAVLTDKGVHTSKKLILKLMHEMGLQSIGVNAKKTHREYAPRENKLQRQFDVTAPNKVWVSDITQFKVLNRIYFICVVLDLFSRKVLACKIGLSATTQLATSTFRMAFEDRNRPKGLLFHSDQGTQYTSYTFRKTIEDCQVMQSFSCAGQPYDNAVAEAFFALFKKEELYRRIYRSERELRESIDRYIDYYNRERPHRHNQYHSPMQAEADYWHKNTEVVETL